MQYNCVAVKTNLTTKMMFLHTFVRLRLKYNYYKTKIKGTVQIPNYTLVLGKLESEWFEQG